MKKIWPFALSILILFSFLSSCIIAVVDYADSTGISPGEEFHRILPLEFGGTLSLENINGDIEIYGWDKNEMEVLAEKLSPYPYKRRVHLFQWGYSLPKIDIDKFEDFIKIRTRTASGRETDVVNYYINVPQSIRLKDIIAGEGNVLISDLYGEVYVELRNGDIEIDNFSGSLTASVIKGSIRTSLYDLRREDEIIITTEQGDIIVYLQPEVNVRIEVSTPNGDIFSEFDFGKSLLTEKVSTEIGENGAFLSLTTLNGDIRMKKIKEIQ